MFEGIRIKKKIRKLKQVPMNREFLLSLRSRLEERVDLDLAFTGQKERGYLLPEKGWLATALSGFKIRLAPSTAYVLVIFILASGGAVFAAQRSLPGDGLFPLKVMGEEVRQAMAFSPESKAALNIKFASERIREINAILNERGVDPRGLNVALSRFEDNAERVGAIIESEGKKGKNVSDLKKMSDEAFDKNKGEVENILGAINRKKEVLKAKEQEIKSEINIGGNKSGTAENSGDKQDLLEKLANTREERNLLEEENRRAERVFDFIKEGGKNQPELEDKSVNVNSGKPGQNEPEEGSRRENTDGGGGSGLREQENERRDAKGDSGNEKQKKADEMSGGGGKDR